MRVVTGYERLRRVCQFVLDALTGRLGVLMMTLSYASLAVVLLAYVSTQVYTSSLMEGISARRETESKLREEVGRMTARYASLSSLARVSAYCEGELGMVEAEAGQVIRVTLEGDGGDAHTSEFDEEPVQIPEVLGSNIGDLSEVMSK